MAVDGSWEGESVSLRDAVTGVAHASADVPTPTDTLAALNGLSGLKRIHDIWREKEEEVKEELETRE